MDGSVRAARAEDAAAIGRLLVTLYDDEAPGLLGGDRARLAAFFTEMTLAEDGRRLRNRLVVQQDGEVVALGALGTREEPREPPPLDLVARRLPGLGPLGALRTVVGAVRAQLAVAPVPEPDEAELHSVVVAREARGRGYGALLIAALEDEGRGRGKRLVRVQVIRGNAAAVRLYERLGYTIRERLPTSPLLAPVALHSVLMRKAL